MPFNTRDEAEKLRDQLIELATLVKEHDPTLALKCYTELRLLIEVVYRGKTGTGSSKQFDKGVAALFSQTQRNRIQDAIERRRSITVTPSILKDAIPVIEEANGNGECDEG